MAAKTLKTWNAQALHSLVKARDAGTYATGVNNLSFRVSKSGIASWVWQARVSGRPSTYVVGHFPATSLADARQIASAMVEARDAADIATLETYRYGSKARGKAKAAAPSPTAGITTAEAWALYMKDIETKNKPSTLKYKQYFYDRRIASPLGNRPLAEVTGDDLEGLIDDIRAEGKLEGANSGIAYIQAWFAWCVRAGRRKTGLKDNPTLVLEKTPPNRRERYLTDSEIAALWRALESESETWRDGYRLCLLTGQRKMEIFGLHSSEIDLSAGMIELSGKRTKNGRPHMVPAAPMALKIIKRRIEAANGGFLFATVGKGDVVSGFSRTHARIRAKMTAAGFTVDWTVHDLRRTVSTHMNGLLDKKERPLILPATIEALLNHSSGAQSGVAGTYNRHSYLAEKRAALQLWEKRLKEIV